MQYQEGSDHNISGNDEGIALGNLHPFRARTKYVRVPSDFTRDRSKLPTSAISDGTEDSLYIEHNGQQQPDKMARTRDTKAVLHRIKRYMQFASSVEKDDPENNKPSRGWRKPVFAAAGLTGAVLFINLVILVVGVTRFKPSEGVGTLYTGNCASVKHWDTALHLFINVLATAVLGASNFAMQCLSSPTRSEVDRAHDKRVSLDIGLPSIKNLMHVKWQKVALWWALALSSLPLHLLWNSTVFSTLAANDFLSIIIDEGFLNGDPFQNPGDSCIDTAATISTTTFDPYLKAYRAGNYSQRLSPSECISAYGRNIISSRRNLLAISDPVAGSTKMSPGCAFSPPINNSYSWDAQPLWNGSSVLAFENHADNSDLKWLCWGYDDFVNTQYPFTSCDRAYAQQLLAANGTWYLRPFDTRIDFTSEQAYPIKYCLSEDKVPEKCALQYSSTILAVVVACNFIKLVSMIATALFVWDLKEPIFATVGDAVASYLEHPDSSTTGFCLMSRTDTKAWSKNPLNQPSPTLYKPPKRRLLFSATSKSRYFTTMSLCTLYLTAGLVLYHFAFVHAQEYLSSSQIWALGLGEINANTSLQFYTRYGYATTFILNILVANSFQLALSITYFLYNALYTAQCGALEWSSYALKKRPLRVTHPRGQQRSTYWLQLPYTYSLLLGVFLMLMHFLISQAVFIARVQWYDELGETGTEMSNVGFSPVGILASCCVGAFLIAVQVLHSLRPLEERMPVHGNKSAVISAACHPGVSSEHDDHGETAVDDEANMALRTVMWGATVQPYDDNSVGHCSLTSEQVEMPVKGRMYQGRPG